MKLLEFFILLELKDRLSHVAQIMQKKITQRWSDKVDDGMTNLPQDWNDALSSDVLPDGMTMQRHKEWSQKYGQKMSKWIVEWFSQFDPTKNKKYTHWILNQWLTDKLWLEDAPKLIKTLETFEQHRKTLHKAEMDIGPPPKQRADINAWKDYRDLARAMRPLTGIKPVGVKVSNLLKKPEIQGLMHHRVPDPVTTFGENGDFDIDEIESEGHTESGQFDTMDWYTWDIGGEGTDTTAIKPIYESDRLAVLQPNTREASCELGKGTEWCTSATEAQNYFWHYATQSPLYVILTDKMGKFQFHFASGQFSNVHDEMLNNKQKTELVKAYPELKKIFAKDAENSAQMWLMEPTDWTPEKLEQFINNKKGMIGNELMYRDNLLFSMPEEWDGQAPEETLLQVEQIIRRQPLEAWRYLRNPTEQDYLNSLQAKDTGTSGYNPATGILRDAGKRGMQLSDKTLEAAMKRDGEAIMYVSPEQMKQHPNWVLTAIQQLPRMLEYAAATAITGEPVWGEMTDGEDAERHKTIIDVLRNQPDGIKAVMNATKQNPSLVDSFRDWFGTEPWKLAYKLTSKSANSQRLITNLDNTIQNTNMKALDYNDLLSFLFQNDIARPSTIKAIESVIGQIPTQFQKLMMQQDPDAINILNNPDETLYKIAQADWDNSPTRGAMARNDTGQLDPQNK